jgi:hypothetical protein
LFYYPFFSSLFLFDVFTSTIVRSGCDTYEKGVFLRESSDISYYFDSLFLCLFHYFIHLFSSCHLFPLHVLLQAIP